MRIVIGAVFLTASAVLLFGSGAFRVEGGDKKKPKYTIKEVMKIAHKGKDSLRAKLLAGTATKEELKKLGELYVAMCQNEPPKGSDAAWKKKCKQIIRLCKAAAAGNEKALKRFKRATSCGACHKVFKK